VRDGAGRAFALKFLRKELLGGTKQKRFQRELIFLMNASHRNISWPWNSPTSKRSSTVI
jgi:hypothetical protein